MEERSGSWLDHKAAYPVISAVVFLVVVVLGPWLLDRPRPAADFSLPIVSASGVPGPDRWRLSDQRGKVVLVDFWATWCGPCQRSTPALVRLQERFRSQGLVVVGVNEDRGSAEVVPSFVQRFRVSYPMVWDDGSVGSQYGVSALPTLVLIDRQGMVRRVHRGFDGEEALASEVEGLLH